MEDKERNNSKVIEVDFRTEQPVQDVRPVQNSHKAQTNPILNRLFKLTHAELSKRTGDYKSFSSFKPEDLR